MTRKELHRSLQVERGAKIPEAPMLKGYKV